jgi:hypothetical protein
VILKKPVSKNYSPKGRCLARMPDMVMIVSLALMAYVLLFFDGLFLLRNSGEPEHYPGWQERFGLAIMEFGPTEVRLFLPWWHSWLG